MSVPWSSNVYFAKRKGFTDTWRSYWQYWTAENNSAVRPTQDAMLDSATFMHALLAKRVPGIRAAKIRQKLRDVTEELRTLVADMIKLSGGTDTLHTAVQDWLRFLSGQVVWELDTPAAPAAPAAVGDGTTHIPSVFVVPPPNDPNDLRKAYLNNIVWRSSVDGEPVSQAVSAEARERFCAQNPTIRLNTEGTEGTQGSNDGLTVTTRRLVRCVLFPSKIPTLYIPKTQGVLSRVFGGVLIDEWLGVEYSAGRSAEWHRYRGRDDQKVVTFSYPPTQQLTIIVAVSPLAVARHVELSKLTSVKALVETSVKSHVPQGVQDRKVTVAPVVARIVHWRFVPDSALVLQIVDDYEDSTDARDAVYDYLTSSSTDTDMDKTLKAYLQRFTPNRQDVVFQSDVVHNVKVRNWKTFLQQLKLTPSPDVTSPVSALAEQAESLDANAESDAELDTYAAALNQAMEQREELRSNRMETSVTESPPPLETGEEPAEEEDKYAELFRSVNEILRDDEQQDAEQQRLDNEQADRERQRREQEAAKRRKAAEVAKERLRQQQKAAEDAEAQRQKEQARKQVRENAMALMQRGRGRKKRRKSKERNRLAQEEKEQRSREPQQASSGAGYAELQSLADRIQQEAARLVISDTATGDSVLRYLSTPHLKKTTVPEKFYKVLAEWTPETLQAVVDTMEDRVDNEDSTIQTLQTNDKTYRKALRTLIGRNV